MIHRIIIIKQSTAPSAIRPIVIYTEYLEAALGSHLSLLLTCRVYPICLGLVAEYLLAGEVGIEAQGPLTRV